MAAQHQHQPRTNRPPGAAMRLGNPRFSPVFDALPIGHDRHQTLTTTRHPHPDGPTLLARLTELVELQQRIERSGLRRADRPVQIARLDFTDTGVVYQQLWWDPVAECAITAPRRPGTFPPATGDLVCRDRWTWPDLAAAVAGLETLLLLPGAARTMPHPNTTR